MVNGHHHVDPEVTFQDGKRLLAIAGLKDLVSLRPKAPGNNLPHRMLILDHQDSCRMRQPVGHGRPQPRVRSTYTH
jgi:hypothetical protein